jgi:hypothetical protein
MIRPVSLDVGLSAVRRLVNPTHLRRNEQRGSKTSDLVSIMETC